jgi:hypothetical protein
VPAEVTTPIGPVTAPAGTTKVSVVSLSTVKEALEFPGLASPTYFTN